MNNFRVLRMKVLQNNSGFIVPLKNLRDTYFYGKDELVDCLKSSQCIVDEVIKCKNVSWGISYFTDLFEIKEMLSDWYSLFNYSFKNYGKTNIIKRKKEGIINDLNILELKFSSISVHHVLSSEEFKLIWELLISFRVRFSLSYIILKLNLLSECLYVLSLWADCHEIQSLNLEYSESDIVFEQKVIDWAITDFRSKFGFIKKMKIVKNTEQSFA